LIDLLMLLGLAAAFVAAGLYVFACAHLVDHPGAGPERRP